MNRRTLLTTGVAMTGTAMMTGCLADLLAEGPTEPPTVADRPTAVYVPSHVEGMSMVGSKRVGDVRMGLFFSFPHRFWLVTGSNREVVSVEDDDSMHLMSSVWDPETGMNLPVGSISATVTDENGNAVVSRNLWSMISQNMGIHFGDNVALDGNGTYEVTLSMDPIAARRTGSFRTRFGDRAESTFSLEFDQSALDDVRFERLEDRKGQRGAVDSMNMEMLPISRTPPRGDLPGQFIGQGRSGDAAFIATVLDSSPAGIETDGPYLAVSPRTPYNRYPLPFMSLSVSVARSGEQIRDLGLPLTVDPTIGIHYGATVNIESGDELTVTVETPPQLARHEGYETAFMAFEDVSMTVP